MMHLFDDFNRVETGPATYLESRYSFLSRSADPSWMTIRQTLNSWFLQFPAQAQKDLRERFRSNDDIQHLGALSELVLYQLITCLGGDAEPHPEYSGTDPYKPDFKIIFQEQEPLYLEVTTAWDSSIEELKDQARKNAVYDAINRMQSPDYFIGMDLSGSTTSQPPGRKIRKFLEEKIKTLNYQEMLEKASKYGLEGMPKWLYSYEGWSIIFYPIPKKPEARADQAAPIGIQGHESGLVTSHLSTREALQKKAKKYQAVTGSLVIAVNQLGTVVDNDTETQALFGDQEISVAIPSGKVSHSRKPNGFWTSPTGPRNQHVSAVLMLRRMVPFSIPETPARLYLNPWATDLLHHSPLLQLPLARVENAHIKKETGKGLWEILEIPKSWSSPPLSGRQT